MIRHIFICLILSNTIACIHAIEVEKLQVLAMRTLVKARQLYRHFYKRQDIRDCVTRIKAKNHIDYAQLITTFGMKEEENVVIQEQSIKLIHDSKYRSGKVKEWANQVNAIAMMPKDLQTKIWDTKNKITLRAAQAE